MKELSALREILISHVHFHVHNLTRKDGLSGPSINHSKLYTATCEQCCIWWVPILLIHASFQI